MANIQTGFNNDAAVSAYPFTAQCSRIDVAGNVLPAWLVVDIGLTLPAGMSAPYLRSAYVGSQLYSAVIACAGTPVLVASAAVTPGVDTLSVVMNPLVPGASGRIVFGVAPTGETSAGRYTYSEALASNVRFMPSVIRVTRSMPVSDFYKGAIGAAVYASRATGNVTLSGHGDLAIEPDSDTPNNLIARLTGRYAEYLSVCDRRASSSNDTPISRLNGVSPSDDGILVVRLVPVSRGE